MSELLPCPFCGSDHARVENDGLSKLFVTCIECGARSGYAATFREAVAAWNRCAQPAPEAESEALVRALADIVAWTERWVSADHPVATVARKAIAAHSASHQTGEGE